MNAIYPVILAVPAEQRNLRGRLQVRYLSRYARCAVARSALLSGIELGRLRKDAKGVPMPCGEHYWSLSHKSRFVAGVVAPRPIGIDVEKIRPCSPRLMQKIADEHEWRLAQGGNRDTLFFRFWTAKEAVLKTAGQGLSGLGQCRILDIVDAHHLLVAYRRQQIVVAHCYFEAHMASVIDLGAGICWQLPSSTASGDKATTVAGVNQPQR